MFIGSGRADGSVSAPLPGLRHVLSGRSNPIGVIRHSRNAVVAGLWWQTAVDANENRIKDVQGYIFFSSVFWGFWPMFNALTTFPSERSVLVKERASGCYRLSAYFCAKSLSDVPLYTMMPTVYALVTFHCLGLHRMQWAAASHT